MKTWNVLTKSMQNTGSWEKEKERERLENKTKQNEIKKELNDWNKAELYPSNRFTLCQSAGVLNCVLVFRL